MSQGTNKLQILNHCSKDFQCRIVAFMLNIRQWYYILRRDSKFLLACVLLSPSVNEEVCSHSNLPIITLKFIVFSGALSHGLA